MVAEGHILVTGGPGSGKTTISILKAAQLAELLRPGQKILFLSFARATISRVIEAIECEQKIPKDIKKLIDVETYHAFFWRILKTHGYLIGLPRQLKILTPPNEAIALSRIREIQYSIKDNSHISIAEAIERERLAKENGNICFCLFAQFVNIILNKSSRICKIIANQYPYIIFDEFQDTDNNQWGVVQSLGKYCSLMALADPGQRIYDFIGADPARLEHFINAFNPVTFDLSENNHRSNGTDIAKFGDDILAGKLREEYAGIVIKNYKPFSYHTKMTELIIGIYAARDRLVKRKIKNWTLAVLVPTKKLTRIVSEALNNPPAKFTKIVHHSVMDMEEIILSAEIVAFLLQSHGRNSLFGEFVNLLVNYYRGKGGDNTTKTAIKIANSLVSSYDDMRNKQKLNKKISEKSIIYKIYCAYNSIEYLKFSGNPDDDWNLVRNSLDSCECQSLREISRNVRYARLIERGTYIRHQLSNDWVTNGEYFNALMIIRNAFIHEYFAMKLKQENGIIVMNMHKSKGKQFDEVIIFEDAPIIKKNKIISNPGRIVKSNDMNNANNYSRQLLRVSVTRSRFRTTILTPSNDPCVLLC